MRPSLSGANSLKTTISSPKERARQAQKMAILARTHTRGCSEGGEEGARRVFFRGANTHENVFPKRRGVLRTRTKRQCTHVRVQCGCVYGAYAPDQHLRLAHVPAVLLHNHWPIRFPVAAVDDAACGLHEGRVELELLRGPG